jgi:hypothetical protein
LTEGWHARDRSDESGSLGAGNVFGSPSAGSGSRQITSVAITTGTVTVSGTAAYWAAVDSVHSQFLAAGALNGTVAVLNGQTFSLDQITINVPKGPAIPSQSEPFPIIF